MPATDALLILCNVPDATCAHTIAQTLVERRLAACVNILAPCQSVYRWQGKVETASEVPLLIKSTAERYAELESALRSLHPYEVPEIIALPIAAGLPAYLAWLVQETA
ncbi:divalent-cation tolerance protein CutA [Uliginosibacterium sp. TH139]|jgi:periplasmic divalent cation tolerance protein|uniref:divalent-cation tolerance protein CutA n=1 Tax=Uliginosibacterium sp. TH139 TaxID=2067453 RepID=UPI000C7AF343|nr:divalent-cation tolerance protein CutA [Uliginosibacterium sp. TH139]PLK50384.1 divalent-cation tolerance protein CutA [Uliginosibacterium sp. TH139]